jgi:PAS domain S-box-containing protein
MTKKNRSRIPEAKTANDISDLRRRAEERLLNQPGASDKIPPKDVESIVHELRVNQIELEMQNEELRHTQQQLEASREKYFDLYELAPVGYVTLNDKGIILESNLTAAALLGQERSSLVGQPLTRFIFREDQDLYSHHHKQLFETRQRQECKVRMLKGDGTQLWAQLQSLATQGSVDAPTSRIAIRDITERIQAEQELDRYRKHLEELVKERTIELTESERRLRRAEEVASIGNWEFIMDDNVVHASDGTRMIYGLGTKEWSITDVQKIPLPKYRTTLDQALKALIEQGSPYNVKFKIRRPVDGKIIDIQSLAEYDSANRIVFGFIQDITERNRSEESLRLAEKTFRNLLETIQLLAVMLDREGNITFCNDSLMNLTGWNKEEVLGQNWFDLFVPGKERAKIKKVFSSVINGEKYHVHYENNIVARNGRELLISWNNTVLHDLEENVTGTASIGIDITEHRNLEAQLRQAQKMEAVGLLAGGIAHDFNNILTAIMGFGHLVRLNLRDNNPMAKNVDKILESADRAAQLTRSLLAFSRTQAINPKPIDVNAIIRRFEELVSRLIGEHIEVSTVLGNTEMIINADEVQIEQVLMNLATNARDAMPNGGYFSISTLIVEPDEVLIREHPDADSDKYVLISVSDTGVGMTKELLENIFDPFYTTKEFGRGTGLGLSMVYGIIEQHNGYISVNSTLNKGSVFNIYLPLYKPEMEVSVAEAVASSVIGGSETILVAEDDDKLRELAKIVLKQHGYHVILAENGEDAVTQFIAHKDEIQLVLLDMIMPKKSGKEAYDEIKKIKPGIKTIFSSGYTADKIDDHEMRDERLDLIIKPWPIKLLLIKVREVLDRL